MMKRATMLVVLVLALSTVCFAQWGFKAVFPPAGVTPGDTMKSSGFHGIAVDNAGKVWVVDYYGRASDSLLFPDYLLKYTVKDSTSPSHNNQVGDDSALVSRYFKPIRAIYVFNKNGTPYSGTFTSPIKVVTNPGPKQDTVGADRLFNAKSGWTRFDPANSINSGRGLRRGWDGNIYASYFGNVFSINPTTGAGVVKKIVVDLNNSIGSVGVDAFGDIFAGFVAGGNPIKTYDNTGTALANVAASSGGFSRCVISSSDGNDVYRADYTAAKGLLHYHSDLGAGTTYTLVDTLLKGFSCESMMWDRKNSNIIWAGAGSQNDVPNPPYTKGTHYAYNISTKAIVDSIRWQWGNWTSESTKDERPRGIDFSTGGDTAYICVFGDGAVPGIRIYQRGLSAVRDEGRGIPEGFALEQNFPNPFNPTTEIRFSVGKTADVALVLYDILGREVAVLMYQNLTPGSYHYTLNASSLASGTYIYELRTGDVRIAKKMTLLK